MKEVKQYNQKTKRPEKDAFYNTMHELALKPENGNYNNFLLVNTESFIRFKLNNKMTKTQMRNVFELIKNCLN